MPNHPYDVLDVPGSTARLILTPCPGSKATSVGEALATLQAAGAEALITLMPSEELVRNEVAQLSQLCTERDLEWLHLPVADEQVPLDDFDQAWAQSVTRINELLDAGKSIAIHCKGGSGRTGLIAARILIERQVSREAAIASVQALRPRAIQHPAHVGWIERFDA
ncbi:protein phosphatase [Pseudomonas stutzeri]|uniref:Protein phosphatase n=1 Tax=Stutzerimonas stutzeri KOS6 TaxID=1218352 RepID=A0A061JNL4_STUST|nr:cyclin-dependent kinase inhibitor 3 family protein [Stutzerimonas stutzeri]EWC39915.1 protein phosphatase [Stutzerimonas stutzeri KOS6]MBK3869258.1 protein phosphatase [Stutzerimonas stutzeri]MBK3869302.1 protein phosphatase [Stutzerimonas stutzeri]